MRYAVVAVAGLWASWSALSAAPPESKLALKGLDPIALAHGKEVVGLDSLETTHGLFRYRFATKENKAAFEANPEERGIQFGGACGKMGPFSGPGSPERFFVHDHRIYVFASESCRTNFKKDPEKYIERPNATPEGSEAQRKRGAELIELALAGFGGARRVDSLKTLQETARQVYKQGEKEYVSAHRIQWTFPDRVRIVEEFTSPYGFVVDGAKGFQIAGKEDWRLEKTMRDVAWRQALRQPLAMLKNRNAKGFVAVAKGKAKLGDDDVELLTVALDGAASTWSVEPKSGRIIKTQYEARRATVGDIVVHYSDFRAVDGLVVPFQRKTFFNGKEATTPSVQIQEIAPNREINPAIYAPTK